MVNYYEILNVSPKATKAEIKSAYRRLARRLHPDANQGSEATALRFAAIAEAYEVLGNSKERNRYDLQIAELTSGASLNGDSVLASDNPLAQRWRELIREKRYSDILDRMQEEQRREAASFQKAVYPLAALLIGCVISAAVKPRIFTNSEMIGKLIIVTFFVVGIIHIIGRIKDGIDRYTVHDDDIHDSILDGAATPDGRYSRTLVALGLIGAVLGSIGLGILIGSNLNEPATSIPDFFSTYLKPEFIFYPPIITFLADVVHSVVARLVK
jgi:hypothetical protein